MQNIPSNYVFDATQYEPDQGGQPVIPDGNYKARITDTDLKPTNGGDGLRFTIEHTIIEGQYAGVKLTQGFNLFNPNEKTVEIAHKQLSAVSHVTGIFRIEMQNKGQALRGAQLQIVVITKPKTAANGDVIPNAFVNDVRGVLDINGNKPGKAGSGAQPASPAPAYNPAPAAAAPAPQPAYNPAPAQPAYNPAPAQPAAPANNGFQVQNNVPYPPANTGAPAATPPAQPAYNPQPQHNPAPAWGGQPQPAAPQQPFQPAAAPAQPGYQPAPGAAPAWGAPAA